MSSSVEFHLEDLDGDPRSKSETRNLNLKEVHGDNCDDNIKASVKMDMIEIVLDVVAEPDLMIRVAHISI